MIAETVMCHMKVRNAVRLGMRSSASAARAVGRKQLLDGVRYTPLQLATPRAPRQTSVRHEVAFGGAPGRVPEAYTRTDSEHAALIHELKHETDSQVALPERCHDWPPSIIRRFLSEGYLSPGALRAEPPCTATRRLIDEVGRNLPIVDLPLLHGLDGASGDSSRSLLGALHSHDGGSAALSSIADAFLERDCVAIKVGFDLPTIAGVIAEGEHAWPLMRPGELRDASDGGTVVGRSPSGARRGDRHVLVRELEGGPDAWLDLHTADTVIGAAAAVVAARLGSDPRLKISIARRSDSFLACFPADDGLGYGNHYDGDDLCQLTLILYTSTSWQPEDGGVLRMLDERHRCWWSVPPRADTLVMFRSDRVLHHVTGCHASQPRYALTTFLSSGTAEAERAALVSIVAGML